MGMCGSIPWLRCWVPFQSGREREVWNPVRQEVDGSEGEGELAGPGSYWRMSLRVVLEDVTQGRTGGCHSGLLRLFKAPPQALQVPHSCVTKV